MTPTTTAHLHRIPSATDFVESPLRNRIRVDLRAPVAEVWALVGDLSRLSEYSSGIERCDPGLDPAGACVAYVCHFKPAGPDGTRVAHREVMRWYAPPTGYASSPTDDNAFGLRETLTLVTLEPSREGTLLTWDEHFEADDVAAQRTAFHAALADIAENLVRRFGGRTILQHGDR